MAVGVLGLVPGCTCLKGDAERKGDWGKSSHKGNVEDSLRRKAMGRQVDEVVLEPLLWPAPLKELNLSFA